MLIQVQSSEKCTERYTIVPGPIPRDGRDGVQGVPGSPGDKGDRGSIGPAGSKGDQGSIGPAGHKGDQGNTGLAGSKGDKGSIGLAGSKGDKGSIGPAGFKGDKGSIGLAGSKGDRGSIGPAGSKGDQGNTGLAGSKGDKGSIGPGGSKGDKGSIGSGGSKGDKGSIGSGGSKGDKGSIGPAGSKGDRGNTGLAGSKGDKGSIGPGGSKGNTGSIGPGGSKGDRGNIGPTGPKGIRGNIGPAGPKGDPGSVAGINESVNTMMSELRVMNETLNKFYILNKCGVFGNGRRIAYYDTTKGYSCPTGLRTVTNTGTRQTACGRSVSSGCTSLQFSPNGTYTNVCGRARGYQFYEPEAFNGGSIDSYYLHGVSITHGTPRTHLWSYVAGETEQYSYTGNRCPCAKPDPTDRSGVPSFVGEDFYCESGFSGSNAENRIAWEDPLWDGQGCFASGNQCCNRYGWFHREISATSDNIEVRWCADTSYTSNEDVVTDQLEIWVM